MVTGAERQTNPSRTQGHSSSVYLTRHLSRHVAIRSDAQSGRDDFHDKIVAYYDECEVDYRIVWHLKNHLCLHYGYWEPQTRRLRDALRLMNLRLSEIAQIRRSDSVLDAGCGVGGSAIFLAETYGCRVHGITLSERQVSSARQNARNRNVEHLTSFDRGDFCRSGMADEKFDVVWALESVCHAPRKGDFLAEARRLLRAGGRLIVADFFQAPGAAASPDYQYLKKWADCWAVPAFERPDLFVGVLERLGFGDIAVRDVSEKVFPTVRRLYRAFVPGLICSTVLNMVGKRSVRQWANTWSTYYQYKAFASGTWRYLIVTALK